MKLHPLIAAALLAGTPHLQADPPALHTYSGQ